MIAASHDRVLKRVSARLKHARNQLSHLNVLTLAEQTELVAACSALVA